MKDPQRFLTDSQKAECLAAANYQCQGRDCEDPDLSNKQYQFHHTKLHSEFGVTTRFRTDVLCVPCHLKVHREKRVELFTESGWDSLRGWQRESLDRFIELEDEKTFVLEAAPGAGKSRFAAFACQYALNEMAISHVVFIAPWLPILTSVKKNFGPLNLEVRDKFHYDKKRGILQRVPMVDVTLDTYSGFCTQTTIDVIEHWQKTYGFSFMLVLDELHHTNTVSGKWGPYVERVAQMASKLLVMSGTYFRSDNRPISFLTYEGDKPKTDHSISFSECVRHRYVRQVSFRFHDPVLEILRTSDGKVMKRKLSQLPPSSPKQNSKAKKEVLNTNGEHVERLIEDAWKELTAMRRKWSDAACLVVCRSGSHGEEERAIHAVESKIKQLTGQKPEVVTSDDATSRGRLAAFEASSEPFLCAIRMVSEGVDIPRIRMVLFLSYTDSEMLFRQIVGRCCRYIEGKEDDTAAMVILPKFRVMAEFAERFEHESKQGALNLNPINEKGPSEQNECETCGESPCQCGCVRCGANPCVCFLILDSESSEDGGRIASASVAEEFIQRAKLIRDSSPAHQHANVVQLGDALQRNAQMGAALVVSEVDDRRRLAFKKIVKKVEMLARLAYGGDYQACWRAEVYERFKVDHGEMQSTWRLSQLTEVHEILKNRIAGIF